MVRQPVVAGAFYKGDEKSLKKQIEESFSSKFGPGLPKTKTHKKIIGAIAPHAGYEYSAPCAAHTYKAIAEANRVETYILLSPNHTGFGRTSLITENYQTPFGQVEIDRKLANLLLKNSLNLIDDMSAHFNEHSLEVQLPFLQYLYQDTFRIVPIVISSPYQCIELADGIAKSISEYDKSVTIIVSSDFTHYGPNYDYTVFKENPKQNVKELDMGAIEYIKNKDYKGFLEYVDHYRATICGYLPIAVMLKALENKIKKVELLKYYQSSDIIPDKENSVSYASVVLYG